MIGVPLKWFCAETMPLHFPEPDADIKAEGVRNKRARYREKVLHWLTLTAGAFRWGVNDILENIPLHTIETWLQAYGWCAIIRKNGKYHLVSGINAGFRGTYTEYYMPVGVVVSAPYCPDKIDGEYTFGEDAVLLRNDTYMQGLYPTICPRCELSVENDVSILCGLQNLRIINIIHAATDKMREAAASFLRQIRWGRSGIITGSEKTWSGSDTKTVENIPTGGVPANYMQQLVETAQYLRGSMYNDLGLQSNFNMKRETLNDGEIAANTDTLRPLIDNMFECRQAFCEEVKRVFGVEISVDLSGAWKTRKENAEAEAQAIENAAEPEPETPAEPEKEEGAEDVQNPDTK